MKLDDPKVERSCKVDNPRKWTVQNELTWGTFLGPFIFSLETVHFDPSTLKVKNFLNLIHFFKISFSSFSVKIIFKMI